MHRLNPEIKIMSWTTTSSLSSWFLFFFYKNEQLCYNTALTHTLETVTLTGPVFLLSWLHPSSQPIKKFDTVWSHFWAFVGRSSWFLTSLLAWSKAGRGGVEGHSWRWKQSILRSAISVIWQAHQSPLCSCVQSPCRTQSSLDGHESGAAVAFQISCSRRFLFDVLARPQIRLRAAGVINVISSQSQNRQLWWSSPVLPVRSPLQEPSGRPSADRQREVCSSQGLSGWLQVLTTSARPSRQPDI